MLANNLDFIYNVRMSNLNEEKLTKKINGYKIAYTLNLIIAIITVCLGVIGVMLDNNLTAFFIVSIIEYFILIFLSWKQSNYENKLQTLKEKQKEAKQNEEIYNIFSNSNFYEEDETYEIECPYCKGIFSNKEKSCPFCGASKSRK